ncbi:alpha/beta fold hydrolase [Peristeroidobacter agariperforans]|uniref:alpha/beta fold hydrolase n=1 Tax=Peristeroidobacter agariperforans TaxID=268404 RepID=UPI00101D1A1A|nr:alpha/beta hydrolase [Peristeroidobacter agariperforans]
MAQGRTSWAATDNGLPHVRGCPDVRIAEPDLRSLAIPTLVITGDHDFIPVDIAEHIAQAVPNARLVTLKDCGHFAYLECHDAVRQATEDFFRSVK